MAGQAAGGHTAAGLKNNGLASLLLNGRANINQSPPSTKNILRVQMVGREEVKWREGGTFVFMFICVTGDLEVKLNRSLCLIRCRVKLFFSEMLRNQTEQRSPTVQGVQTLNLNLFFCWMHLSFALVQRWSLVFSAGLGFALVLLMDPDWSWGAGWRRWEQER